jgi:cysteinyl-tRNA synthetase
MPRALAVAWGVLKDGRPAAEKLGLLYKFDEVMGLGLETYQPPAQEIPAEVNALVERRAQARKAKDWKESDRLRDEIAALGYAVKDTPEGPVVTKK